MENMEHIVQLKKIAQDFNILFVEDSKALQTQVAKFLNKLFKNVYIASDGKEGIEAFKKYKPDIILTDLTMPNMNGHEMIREIKKIDADISIIILSAHSDSETLMKSFHIGVNDFIAKPVNAVKMIAVFLKVLSNIKRKEKQIETLLSNHNKEDADALSFILESGMSIDILNHYRGVPIINSGKVISSNEDEIILKTTYIQIQAIKHEKSTILDSSLIAEDLECELISIDIDNYEVKLKKKRLFYPEIKNREELKLEPGKNFKAFFEKTEARLLIEVKDLSIKEISFCIEDESLNFKKHDLIKLSIVFDDIERLANEKFNTVKDITFECRIYKIQKIGEEQHIIAFIQENKEINTILHKYIYNREIELIEEFKTKYQYE
ncbi:response regulator [Poseidonibacter sp.]|uniref:response regulator n=1 Tax=Poseidonibacter sp. TaxID=2321188 RepID=UPI003C769F54